MTRIKICGITNINDAFLAIDEGADALGFIFTESPRKISPRKAKEIIDKLPPFITKVGVFKDEDFLTIKGIMDFCRLDFVQIHGSKSEKYLNLLYPKVIKVFEFNDINIFMKIKKFSLPFFMLDLPKESKNFSIDFGLAKRAKKFGRVILAGGLNPENIEEVLEKVLPYGVDVCRGVEEKEGIKSPEKLKKFIERVRKWDIQKKLKNSEFMEEDLSLKL